MTSPTRMAWRVLGCALLICIALPVGAQPAPALVSVSVERPKSVVSRGLGAVWGYLFSPVNCVAQLGVDVLADGVKFVQCMLKNANPSNVLP